MIRRRYSIIVVFLILFLTGCPPSGKEHSPSSQAQLSAEDILKYNMEIVGQEDQEIKDFAERYQWKLKTTPTGLRYMIYKNGRGEVPTPGARVTIAYSLRLLTGDIIYQADSLNPVTITLGKREVVNGLEEGLMLMNKGSSARLILPPHLGYGLLGDQDKVPSNAILVYDVTLLNLYPKGQ